MRILAQPYPETGFRRNSLAFCQNLGSDCSQGVDSKAACPERAKGVGGAARTRCVPGLVLAEVDYFLRDERRAMQVFMEDLARGAFTYAPPTLGQLSRAMEVDRERGPCHRSTVDTLLHPETGHPDGVET